MKPRKQIAGDKLAARISALCLVLMAAGLLVLYWLCGYFPLLLAGLIQLLPTLALLVLFLPAGKAPPPVAEAAETGEEKPHKKFFKAIRKRLSRLQQWYCKARNGIVVALIAIGAVGIHLVFWKAAPSQAETLGYHIPVILAVLFVLSIALEKWCKHLCGKAGPYIHAILQGLRSAFFLGRIVLLVTVVALMVKLLGFYDAQAILRVVLSLLFVYETLFLAFSLTVRVIRHELGVKPELLVSAYGMDGDMNILTYLEENTGITMRSLWSLHLVRKLIPGAVLGVVLLLWGATGLVQIEAHQEGALFRLGKMQEKPLQPGLHLTLPWPVDRVDVYDTESIGKVTIGYIPTGDQDNIWTESHGGEEYRLLLGGGDEMVSINLQIEYRIDDLVQYIKSSASPESLLQAQAYEIITARTITTDLETLLSTDREAFSESFQEELAQRLAPYETGLTVVNVVLESIHPPVEVAAVYQDIISAGIDAEHMILLAQTDANSQVMDAQERKTVAVSDASAAKYEEIAAAQAAVTEFMAAVAADSAYRDEYRFYKYINALTQAYGDAKLIIAGDGVDTGSIFIGSLTQEEQETEEAPVEDSYDGMEAEVEEDYFMIEGIEE